MSRGRYKYINRDQYEWRAGRIDFHPNMLVWEDQVEDKNKYYPVTRTKPDGSKGNVVLIEVKGVTCPNTELWTDSEWYTNREGEGRRNSSTWVPRSVCRKCEHYMTGNKSGPQRYPRCSLSREKRKDYRTALELIDEALREAGMRR